MTLYMQALAGGMLLGLSAGILLLVNGRIAGISGIFGRLIGGQQVAANALFIAGLLLGPLLYRGLYGAFPDIAIAAGWPTIVIAGLLVGIGSRMGSGCTSGHGILGLARLSKRSIAATGAFLLAGIATATLMGLAS